MIATIDCDVHNAVPEIAELFPFLPARWQDYCVEHGVSSLAPSYYPPGSPLSARPGIEPADGPPGSDPGTLQTQVLDEAGASHAILNCLYAVQPIHNEDWAVAMAPALNDWQATRWLDADPRFRASIVVAPQDPRRAADEIARLAGHPGFVQVLLLAFSEMPLGKRFYWPIHEAAARYRLPVAIHPGMAGPNPTLPVGWPSHHIEDYAAAAQVFQSQLVSLVCEGVFQRCPELTVVLLESGVTWLPSLLWRLDKNWKGLRREIPWVDRPPSEVVREHVRLSVQPFDGPTQPAQLRRVLEHLGSIDLLLFASDYPHWHHRDPETALLQHLSRHERATVLRGNALRIYDLGVDPVLPARGDR